MCVRLPAVAEGISTCELKLNIELLFTHHCCRPRRAHHTHGMTADAYLKQHPYTHKHTQSMCMFPPVSLWAENSQRDVLEQTDGMKGWLSRGRRENENKSRKESERIEANIKQLKFKHVAMTAKISTYTHGHIAGQNIRDVPRPKALFWVDG